MHNIYTIFSELLKLFPRHKFEKAVKRHHEDQYVKTFTAWQQYITILYSQITRYQFISHKWILGMMLINSDIFDIIY